MIKYFIDSEGLTRRNIGNNSNCNYNIIGIGELSYDRMVVWDRGSSHNFYANHNTRNATD